MLAGLIEAFWLFEIFPVAPARRSLPPGLVLGRKSTLTQSLSFSSAQSAARRSSDGAISHAKSWCDILAWRQLLLTASLNCCTRDLGSWCSPPATTNRTVSGDENDVPVTVTSGNSYCVLNYLGITDGLCRASTLQEAEPRS